MLNNPSFFKRFLSIFKVSDIHLPPAQILTIAVWFGLAIGFSEVLFMGFNKLLLIFIGSQQIIFDMADLLLLRSRLFNLNPHSFWLVPLAELSLFSVLGFCLFLFHRYLPKLASVRIATFVLTLTACITVGLIFNPPLHLFAIVLLGLGIAVQISRVIESNANKFYAITRRTLPWMLACLPMLALGVYAWKNVPEYRALSQLPSAKPDTPNVLLFVLDTVRAQSLSVYNYHRQTTPHLEQFAKTGVLFEKALSTSPWTLPSHASMFTGRFPHEVFSDWETPLNGITRFNSDYPTLAEVLSDRGYVTAGFVANTLYGSYTHGLNRGFAHYEDFHLSFKTFLKSSPLASRFFRMYYRMKGIKQLTIRKSAANINRSFLGWLDAKENQRPFFAFLNYFDAHAPYLPPASFRNKFEAQKTGNNIKVPDNSAKAHRALQNAYDKSIAYIDDQIGALLDKLDKKGILENTVVIITSDHGEQFGEHDLMNHTNSLYRQVLQVPLLISFPEKVPVGMSLREAVSLRDLPATIIDLLDLEEEISFPGKSMAPHWGETLSVDSSERESVFSEVLVGDESPGMWPKSLPGYKGGMKSLVTGGYHYIKYGNDREELFDFQNDPEEERDLTNSAEGKIVLKNLRFALENILTRNTEQQKFESVAKNPPLPFRGTMKAPNLP